MADQTPEQRPGPFVQDPSRTPPLKEQRENDYAVEKKDTVDAAKGVKAQREAASEQQEGPGEPAGGE